MLCSHKYIPNFRMTRSKISHRELKLSANILEKVFIRRFHEENHKQGN